MYVVSLFMANLPISLRLPYHQKKSVWIMLVGTFLEYFDAKSHLQLIIILQPLFFPVMDDPIFNGMMAGFSYAMTYLFRPVGALIFGYIGDTYGRKVNVVLTTMLMAGSSFILAILPVYASIGLWASVTLLVMRAVQGMSAGAEQVGAKLYLTENLEAPKSYFYASLVGWITFVGSFCALVACSFFLHIFPPEKSQYGWRLVFFLGSIIAVLGSVARTKLKESKEFLAFAANTPKDGKQSVKIFSLQHIRDHGRNMLAIFCIELGFPLFTFFSFFHLGERLRQDFSYTHMQLVDHNFFLSLSLMCCVGVVCWVARWIHPVRMIKYLGMFLLTISLAFPFIPLKNPTQIFCMQICFMDASTILSALFVRSFPIVGRYTFLGFAQSMARVVGAVLSILPCWAEKYFGQGGLSLLLGFVSVAYIVGIYLFRPHENDAKIMASWQQSQGNSQV